MSTTTLDTTAVRRWNRYPEYRPSQTDMGCEMPAHWSICKVKHIASGRLGSFIDGDWIESPYITDKGIRLIQCGNVGTGVYEEQGFRYISEETFREFKCTEVIPGDVLICRLRSSPRILAGRACIAPDLGCRMITSVDNCILKPGDKFDASFLVYQMSSPAYLQYIEAIARGGTRDRISRSMLADIKLVIPPITEQQAIAAFLDRETARIDALIERKERLIALLEEKRQAVISHTVTRGLDPDAQVKDSVDPWPQVKLSQLLKGRPKNGISPPIAMSGETVPSFSIAAVRAGRVNIAEHVKYVDLTPSEAQEFEVRTGDVLVMRGSGNISLVGTCGVVEDHPSGCIYPDLLIRLVPGPRVRGEFLILVLNSVIGRRQIEVTAQTASGIWKISGEDLAGFRVPVPSLEEQDALMRHINQATQILDKVIARIRDGIASLQEYRTALISAAVTGQIDVRGEVNP